MTEELKKEMQHFIANYCEAASFDINHQLVYHYSEMEKVAEFVFNKVTKELQKDNEGLVGQYNELSNLRSDNERFKAERDVLMNNAKEIIAQFYCWYISSTFKRDLSRIEEARDEAQQFLDDLVFEVSGVEK